VNYIHRARVGVSKHSNFNDDNLRRDNMRAIGVQRFLSLTTVCWTMLLLDCQKICEEIS